jgi:hypothetical protein
LFAACPTGFKAQVDQLAEEQLVATWDETEGRRGYNNKTTTQPQDDKKHNHDDTTAQ